MSAYRKLIESKRWKQPANGFHPTFMPDALFPFQRAAVEWACKKGRAALFEDCGLGKTIQQLTWAENVWQHTGGRVLILAPLAVADQTVREGKRFGITVQRVQEPEDVGASGIFITNYDRADRFFYGKWDGIVLDESSILKAHDGATRNAIISGSRTIPYRLACTATPSPNDHTELGNHAEFLGVMSRTEMLASFFVHDGGETSVWRLKGHAEQDFWRWVAGWAIMMRKPSDLGFSDDGFALPELHIRAHVLQSGLTEDGNIFAMPARTLQEQRDAKRKTLAQRCQAVADLVAREPDQQWLVWCELNDEGDMLTEMIPGAVQVAGSDSDEWKCAAIACFVGTATKDDVDIIGKRIKLAECGMQNTQKTDERNTNQIAQRGKSVSDKGGRRKKTNDICANIINAGESGGIEGRQNSVPGLTHPSEKNTHPAMPFESTIEMPQKNGSGQIQANAKPNDCANTVLRSNNTTCLLRGNRGSVPYADSQICASQEYSHTSITATQQEKLEGYSAQTAITESGSSTTTHTDSPKPSNIYARVLISKGKMFGYGLNLQNCCRMAFVGPSHSYEMFYQSVRRCWRFGQRNDVHVHVISTDVESEILANVQRKQADADRMAEGMVVHMSEVTKAQIAGTQSQSDDYKTAQKSASTFTAHLGDCVEGVAQLPSDSIGYTIFSPPFASLYTYSNSPFDMGNCKDNGEFFQQFKMLIPELLRVTMPGRLLSFHCMDMPTSKERDGFIGLRDFSGDLTRAFTDAGWIFHSKCTIWKDPVTAMQRTKALGLLHKTIRKDSAMSRQGIADYLVTMRKPGLNTDRVYHYRDEDECREACEAKGLDYDVEKDRIFPVGLWQNYASPVWMDINPSDTLQKESAREHNDERHICPLQLEVIRRALHLWTNPNDLVLSPFMGIGSEGVSALRMGRRFVGYELKKSYYDQAVANLNAAEQDAQGQQTIFSESAP